MSRSQPEQIAILLFEAGVAQSDVLCVPDCAFMPYVLKAKEQGTGKMGSRAGA
jgi:hypothetical protein